MAKRIKYLGLPRDTKIEVVGTHPKHGTFKKEMTFGQALNLEKKKGWTYRNYQLGFSSYKIN